jgi:tocopherol O-methyltransferase
MLYHCLSLLPVSPRKLIFDVGCGYGATSLFLARTCRCDVHGISLSSRQVSHAKKKAAREGIGHRVSFSVFDAEEWQPELGSYDLIWVMESSEHFVDKKRFFEGAASSLCPGGVLLLAAWTAGEHLTGKAILRLADASVCWSFSSAWEYNAMLTDAGLLVIKSEDLTDAVLPTWEVARSRVSKLQFLIRFASQPLREFTTAIDLIRAAFRSRSLVYRVFVAVRC